MLSDTEPISNLTHVNAYNLNETLKSLTYSGLQSYATYSVYGSKTNPSGDVSAGEGSNNSEYIISDPLILVRFAEPFQYVLAALYCIAFVAGTGGNLGVIRMACLILRFLSRYPGHVVGSVNSASIRHVLVYVVCLSLADQCVLLAVPFLATDILLTTWVFGHTACKVFLTLESLSKCLSIFLLTSLAADRFMSICHAAKTMPFRKVSTSFTLVFGCLALSLAIMSPVILYGVLLEIKYPAKLALGHIVNHSTSSSTGINATHINATIVIRKCSFDPPEHFMTTFVCYVFALCYCLPAILIGGFYAGIFHAAYIHVQTNSVSAISLKRILRYIIFVTGFYFICWTPYWFYTLFSRFLIHFPSEAHLKFFSSKLITLAYIFHGLPYVNCAVNPVIYAFLNADLRDTLIESQNNRRRKQSQLMLQRATEKQQRQRRRLDQERRALSQSRGAVSDVNEYGSPLNGYTVSPSASGLTVPGRHAAKRSCRSVSGSGVNLFNDTLTRFAGKFSSSSTNGSTYSNVLITTAASEGSNKASKRCSTVSYATTSQTMSNNEVVWAQNYDGEESAV